MSINRNKEADRASTKLLLLGSPPESLCDNVKGTNWLGHRLNSDAHQLDMALLEGATREALESIRGAVQNHLSHLQIEHGIICKEVRNLISYDSEDLGIIREWTERGGYNPEDYAPTADPEELDHRVQKLRKTIKVMGIPKGQKHPQPAVTSSSAFARDPLVKAWVLENALGNCEGCGTPAPFSKASGEPFLEVHHLKLLAEKGTDTVENTVALCPNCHRRCHHSSDRVTFTDGIYLRVPRLVRE